MFNEMVCKLNVPNKINVLVYYFMPYWSMIVTLWNKLNHFIVQLTNSDAPSLSAELLCTTLFHA